jgi:hypothetical protein
MMGIRAGQSFERAYKLFNPNGKYDVGDVDDLHACNIYRSRNGQISALVERGIITSVATDDVRFRTISNVGPGSSENELKSAYGNRLKRQPGEYDGTEYFLYSDSGNGIKFYVERGKVLGVTAGGGSIRYVEGCL